MLFFSCQTYIYKFLIFQTRPMSKTYRHEKKGHDDYLMNSNKVIKSVINEQETKKMKTRKLSLSYNPAAKQKHRSVLKFTSVSKGSQNQRLKSGKKQKLMIEYDELAIKTTKTDEESMKRKQKKSLEPKISVKTTRNVETSKKQQRRNRSKIKLDSLKNKKPLKLSESGRFHYDDVQTETQPVKNFTQITSHDNEEEEDKQTKTYYPSCINNPGELEQIYSRCTSILDSYRKKLNELSKQNSKLKIENKKLKHVHR